MDSRPILHYWCHRTYITHGSLTALLDVAHVDEEAEGLVEADAGGREVLVAVAPPPVLCVGRQ